MIPDIDEDVVFSMDLDDTEDYIEDEEPSKTYKLDNTTDRIAGDVDEIEALKQAIYHMLTTERYDYLIYSFDYGVETRDLIGKSPDYVAATLELRIKEALEMDDRIDSVDDFSFEIEREQLHVTFTVHSIFGDFVQEGDFGNV